MVVRPPSAPRTSATRSDEACQAPAAAGSRPVEAPRAAGSTITSTASTPLRVRARSQTSRPMPIRRVVTRGPASRAGTRIHSSGAPQRALIAARARAATPVPPAWPTSHSARPPPRPAPPRLAVCVQPAIGPRSSGVVVSAIAAVAPPPTNTPAALPQKVSVANQGRAAEVIGVRAKATRQAVTTAAAIAYQRRGVRLTSITGPATNAQVCGSRLSPTMPDTAATPTPWWPSTNPRVTVTNPVTRPPGRCRRA